MSDDSNKPERARQADTSERYLTFLLGKDHYAIPLLQVKEVIEMKEPTQIPQAPPFFKGIINLRGRVISVLDLRAKLSLEIQPNGPKTAIIILELGEVSCIGIIVDRVNSVLAFQSNDISTAPDTLDGRESYLTGIARRDKTMTLILNIKAALGLTDDQLENIKKQNQAA